MPFVGSVLDTFDRANEAPLAGSWATTTGETAFNLTTNVAVPSAVGSDAGSKYTGRTWTGNQASKAVFSTAGNNGASAGPGLAVRVAAAARTYYRFTTDHNAANNCEIRRFVAGVTTQLVQFTQAWTNGDTWELTVDGPTGAAVLRVFLNGVQASTVTDTAGTVPASGSPGIAYSSTAGTSTINDWVGSDYFADVGMALTVT